MKWYQQQEKKYAFFAEKSIWNLIQISIETIMLIVFTNYISLLKNKKVKFNLFQQLLSFCECNEIDVNQ